MSKISIIIPIYNAKDYLRRCLDSVVKQTNSNLEIILVDDGSTDTSLTICNEYAEKDARIVVVSQKNQGVSAARNKGIEIATGDYLGFVDSDDVLSPNMYDILMKLQESTNADITSCRYTKFTNQYDFSITNHYSSYNQTEALFLLLEEKELTNFLWDKLFKKSLFENIKFKEGLIFEDLDVMYKLFAKMNKITLSHSILYAYYQREDSYVHTYAYNKIANYIMIYQERYQFLSKNYPSLQEQLTFSRVHSIFIVFRMITLSKNKQLLDDQMILEQYQLLKQDISKTAYHTTRLKKILIQLLSFNRYLFYFITRLLYKLKGEC